MHSLKLCCHTYAMLYKKRGYIVLSADLICNAMMIAHFAAMHMNDRHCKESVRCRWFKKNKL